MSTELINGFIALLKEKSKPFSSGKMSQECALQMLFRANAQKNSVVRPPGKI